MNISTSGRRFTAEASTVFSLIRYAYGLKHYQVEPGGSRLPLDDAMYDIAALTEGQGVPTRDEFGQMLQGLLADRFKLEVHRETRNMPVYVLVTGKSGTKFKESAPGTAAAGLTSAKGRNYEVTWKATTLDGFLSGLWTGLDLEIVNRTGLTGTYDIQLTYTPENLIARRPEPDSDISIFDAVREQLGLRLAREAVEVEVLVVDRVERPSAN